MSITQKFIEPAIMYSFWEGNVSPEEIIRSQANAFEYLNQHQIKTHVTLINLESCQNMSFDVRVLTQLLVQFKQKRLGVVLVKPKPSYYGIIKLLSTLLRMPFIIAHTEESGLNLANKLWQERLVLKGE